MIAITVTIDATKARFLLDQVGSAIPKVVAQAVNETRNQVQVAVQRRLVTDFTIAPSRLQFMQRLIKRTATATPAKPVAEVSITGPSGKAGRGRAGLLSRHVFGGVHSSLNPTRPFFIPAQALRPGDYDVAPRSLFPSALRLINSRAIDGSLLPLKTNSGGQIANTKRVRIAGKTGRGSTELRSFFVAPIGSNARTPGIYERIRTGADKGDLQLLWLYKQRINLGAPRLPFFAIARATIADTWQRNVEAGLRAEIRRRL